MADLPFPWSLYQEKQLEAARCSRITDRSWGIDSGLTKLLTTIESGRVPSDREDLRVRVDRTIATGSWNERNRARLRRKYLSPNPAPNAERRMVTRLILYEIQNAVSAPDWTLLLGIAAGLSHSELATHGLSDGSVRTRVSRLRMRLRATPVGTRGRGLNPHSEVAPC